MHHSFNVEIAVKFGIKSAVILSFFEFWISKNKANEKHFHDGMYWTYNSRKALQEIFPYMTDWDIRVSIQKLCDGGVLVVGNYNDSPIDKTNWYAITDYGFQILKNPDLLHEVQNPPTDWRNSPMDMQNSPMEGAESTNGLSSINNINIYNSSKPVNNNSYKNNICASCDAQSGNVDPVEEDKKPTKEDIEKHFEELWKLYPLKKGKGAVSTTKKKYLFNISVEEWKRAIDRYLEYVKNASFDLQLMHGSTFCNSGHVDYLDKNYSLEDQKDKVPEVAEEPRGPVDYGWGDD